MLCVRWYLSFKLSSRDLVAMMAERNIELAHTTILRWVQHYAPEFEKRWKRYARPVGGSWRMDETYIKCFVEVRLHNRSERARCRPLFMDASGISSRTLRTPRRFQYSLSAVPRIGF